MTKKCIFCGKPVSEKSREHVIPQWLIEMTGDIKRTAAFGMDYSKIFDNRIAPENIKSRKYPFLQFTFPACKKCNEKYGSELEGTAKIVITKVLAGQEINMGEIVMLLDWFDKVRIGLWLGYLYYNEQMESIDPKFYIDDRMGQKDRALYVYKCKGNTEGINIVGPGGMLFSMIPSCFLLRINNYVFLSISKDALLLKDLGYPYPTMNSIDGDGNMCGTITAGLGVINQDLLSEYKIRTTSKAIFQPIFNQIEDIRQSKNTNLVSNSLEKSKAIGPVYIKDREIRRMGENEAYLLEPSEVYENLYGLLSILGRKTSRVLIEFANEVQKLTEKSALPDDQKEKMLLESYMAVTAKKLRTEHIKYELPDTSEI